MGTMTLSGACAGLASGQVVIGPVTTTGANIVGEILIVTLSSGDNTFAVPTGSTKVSVVLPQGSSATVKVRTSANPSDGGIPISPVTAVPWYAQDLVSGMTSIILNASGSVPGVQLNFI